MTRRDLGRLMTGALTAAAVIPTATGRSVGSPGLAERWRQDFPALRHSTAGHRHVYLDSAATAQRPAAVINALREFYEHDNANPGKTQHAMARRAYEQYQKARQTLARFINAPSADEIAWVRGTTEGINLVASAWARSTLRPGDEILLTIAEHASNLLPWRLAAEQTGARVGFIDVDDEGRISLEDLDRKLSARTRLVVFSHVSNVGGYVNPAAEICARAHRAGARIFIDAAQSAPHVPLDVQAIGCDFMAFSSHKIAGPMGAGVLWARTELLDSMSPYQSGSNMAHAVDLNGQEFEKAAYKFGAGTPNVADAIGMAAAVDYLESLGREAIRAHEEHITSYGLEQLANIPRLRVLGPRQSKDRIPVFAFDIAGIAAGTLLHDLDDAGIAIRAGDLSALPLLKHFGVSEAARASCYLYTTQADIDEFIKALRQSIAKRS
ncbi:MAG TPA: aminotransferase class V-fold PLP-dependent enzyme [Steroidobacteraceae bacterium]|nr:aminotransferase class V-fold PLP-dependent enzyme [Steroidobacteraceae bacterium]